MKVCRSEFKKGTRVLMSVSGMGFCGTKQVFLNYISILEKIGCNLTLLIRKNSATHEKLTQEFPHLAEKIVFIKYFRINLPFFRNIAISEYKRIYDECKPDIIICHKGIDVYFSKISNIPSKIIGVAHGFISKNFINYIKHADAIISVSKAVSNYLKLIYQKVKLSSCIILFLFLQVFRKRKVTPLL